MSINKHVGDGLALYNSERVLRDNSGVEMTFKKSSHSCEHLKGTKNGHIYLTNFRMIFVNDRKSDMLHQLSVPFTNIKDFEIKQPVFGANYLQGRIVAERDGGWEGSSHFEMVFKNGGAIDIGQKLVDLATKPPEMMYPAAQTIIVYPTSSVQGYAVPGDANTYCFPGASAPPMYPGPSHPPAYQQQPMHNNASANTAMPANAKAAEAYQSTLPPQYSDDQAPPKYDDINKKRE